MSEMSGPTAPDDASFTLPARPGVLLLDHHERVDLLAGDPAPRRLPEGTASGFAVLAALVLFSCLVGGVTAGLVVIGVSSLLAVSAALVTGNLALVRVGGQRGANLLLGVGAAALILGSVISEQDRPTPEVAAGTPVPVSSLGATHSPSTYAARTAAPARPARPSVAVTAPVVAVAPPDAGLTLSPDALAPQPSKQVPVVPATVADDQPVVAGAERGAEKAAADAAATERPGAAASASRSAAPGQAKGNDKGNGKGAANGTAKGAANGNGNGKAKGVGNGKGAASGPAKAGKPAKATKPGNGKANGKAKGNGKAKAPVVRHGFAVVGSAVRDLL
ncbi:hypothetical protein [Terrabacter sp. NPDC080008]|uniref:hypothetical protein n=1 Tax=Terrabacter sp. NPDC080008 TaxID=3155176 RepID=UPI00344E546F